MHLHASTSTATLCCLHTRSSTLMVVGTHGSIMTSSMTWSPQGYHFLPRITWQRHHIGQCTAQRKLVLILQKHAYITIAPFARQRQVDFQKSSCDSTPMIPP